jgi:hypothetical protein
MHAARIEAFLGNLEPPYTSLTASQRLVLSEACAAAVAKNIGVSAASVEDEPGGNPSQTLLTARGTSGVEMRAFMHSSPEGVDWLQEKVYSRQFALDLESAVKQVQPLSMQVMLTEPNVALVDAGGHLGAGAGSGISPSISLSVVLCLLCLAACVGLFAYYAIKAQKGGKQSGTRSARVDSRDRKVQSEDSGEGSDQESDWSEKERIFAEAPAFEEETTAGSDRARIFAEADQRQAQALLMPSVSVPQPSFAAIPYGGYGAPYGMPPYLGPSSFTRRGDLVI